jgi:hypothetical protein
MGYSLRQLAPGLVTSLIRPWLFPPVLLIFSATSALPDGGKLPRACDAEEARFAVGELYSPQLAERARRSAGAQYVRESLQTKPSAEGSPHRLNLEVPTSPRSWRRCAPRAAPRFVRLPPGSTLVTSARHAAGIGQPCR